MRTMHARQGRGRRLGVAAAVAVGLVVPLTMLAAPAVADTPAATTAVSSVGTDITGRLQVTLTDPSALWVQVTVLADTSAGAASLLVTDHMSDAPGDGTVWTTDDPVQLPSGTALGSYPVDVDYRLPGGTVQHWTSTSGKELDYRLRAGVTSASTDRDSVDFLHPSITVTGTVTVTDPSTGDVVNPVPTGTNVRATWLTLSNSVTHTGPLVAVQPDGSYSLTIAPGDTLAYGTVSVVGSPTLATGAQTYVGYISAQPTQARLTASPAAVRVHSGTGVTISGTAQVLTPTGWKAVANIPVAAYHQTTYYQQIGATARTDAAGHYTLRLTATRTDTVSTQVALNNPLLAPQSSQTTKIYVPTSMTYSGGFSLDAYGTVTAKGTLRGDCGNQVITLQYSANGRTGWKALGSQRTPDYGGIACSYSIVRDGYDHGYYRLTNAESNQVLAHTTGSKYLARTPTRFVSYRLSPTKLSASSKLTATGHAQQLSHGKWVTLKHAIVVLAYRPKGDTQFYWVQKKYTSATGAFSLSSQPFGDGYWGVYYQADSTHFYSETKVTYVDVR